LSARGHRQTEHTADLALDVWASSAEELFVEAAVAVVGILTEGATIEAHDERRFAIAASYPDERFVAWLNEIIYLALTEGFLVATAKLALRPDGLDALVRGEKDASAKIQTELKSATYHQLTLEEHEGRHTAHVVIDV
jgi:SHS2 domain-containing protein